MPGLVALQFRVAEVGELGGGQGGGVQAGVGGERGGEFPYEVAEGGAVDAEGPAGEREEADRVTEGLGADGSGWSGALCSAGLPRAPGALPMRRTESGSTCQPPYAPLRGQKVNVLPSSSVNPY